MMNREQISQILLLSDWSTQLASFLRNPWSVDDCGIPSATFQSERPCFQFHPCLKEDFQGEAFPSEPYPCSFSGRNPLRLEQVPEGNKAITA